MDLLVSLSIKNFVYVHNRSTSVNACDIIFVFTGFIPLRKLYSCIPKLWEILNYSFWYMVACGIHHTIIFKRVRENASQRGNPRVGPLIYVNFVHLLGVKACTCLCVCA